MLYWLIFSELIIRKSLFFLKIIKFTYFKVFHKIIFKAIYYYFLDGILTFYPNLIYLPKKYRNQYYQIV